MSKHFSTRRRKDPSCASSPSGACTNACTDIEPAPALTLTGLSGIPAVREGDSVSDLIASALRRQSQTPRDGDIVVVAQKIVSKAEGRLIRLSAVTPTERAVELSAKLGIDARKIEVILRESRRVLRAERVHDGGVIICETHHGLVCANAGVDESNLDESDCVLRLPQDPDASADRLRGDLEQIFGVTLGVVITDSFGRPWRLGLVNVAIGASGLPATIDCRGRRDSAGRPLQSTVLAVADEIAAAAGMVMGKLENTPAVLVRGFHSDVPAGRASDLIRRTEDDLFRTVEIP